MGNGESSFLYITTNCSVYSPGDYIHGEVYLKLVEDIESDFLVINIEGLEAYQINQKKETRGSSEIFNETIICYQWVDRKAAKGDYIFPFNFKLPLDIPGSTSIASSDLSASIKYAIKALVTDSLTKEKEFSVKSKHKLSMSLVKNQISQKFIVKKHCVTRATIDFQVQANKFEYNSEDIMRLEFKGLCEMLPWVKCYIYRRVAIRKDSLCKIIDKKILKVMVQEKVIDIDLKLLERRIGKNTSTKGQFISCSYFIIVVTPKSCCSVSNEVSLSFQLNSSRSEPSTPRYSIPWKPSIIKCQVLEEGYSYDEVNSFYNSNLE